MIENKLCEYGCGQPAKFLMTSGKWCCENFYTKCPEFIRKMILSNTGKKRSKEFCNFVSKLHKNKVVTEIQKEKQRKKMKNIRNDSSSKYNTKEYIDKNKKCNIGRKRGKEELEHFIKSVTGKKYPKLHHYQKRYPFLFKIEKIREDFDTKDLLVFCKNCNKEFPLNFGSYNKISYRAEMIKQNKEEKGLFFCSDDCRDAYINKYKTNYEIYSGKVWRETYKSIKNNKNKIQKIEFRGNLFKYHLDHKYSICEGFKNNIDPKIIGHWKNLEVIESSKNLKKFNKCSITLEDLKKEIEKQT
jgi:hypothetical protein